MLVTVSIPNLVSGVSQQPEALKLSTSLKEAVNTLPSVVKGLTQRPPFEHVAAVSGSVSYGAAGHLIDQKTDYRYLVFVYDGELKVYDLLTGTPQTVSYPNGKGYLQMSLNARNNFRFVTIGDTTFIANRQVKVKELFIGEEGTASFTPDGTVANYAALPTAAIGYLGDVYQTTDNGFYYLCVEIPGLPQILEWEYTGVWDYSDPDGGSLPEATTLGQTFKLSYNPGDGGNETQYWEVVETQAATATTYEWQQRTLSQLVTVTNGRLDPVDRATVYITNSISNSYYSVYINGTLKGTILTKNGMDAANALEGTDKIAELLTADLVLNSVDATQHGSTIEIKGLNATDEVQVTSSNGDKCIKCYRDEIGAFSDLPPNEVEGRIVKVRGAPEENQDDYYVRFTTENNIWEETYGYNHYTSLNPSTMPHVLVRNADGTWTFKQHVWAKREVGDTDSNPVPSFVDDYIQDIYIYSGRLSFLTKTNVIFSEAQEFETYFRTTIATLVDSDPIDMGVINTSNDPLQHAVPFNKDVLILGERSQHRIAYQQFVGPKNIQVNYTTSYSVAPGPHPVNIGSSVYFVDDDPTTYNYAKVFEYFPKQNNATDDAQEVSDPIPTYIPTGVRLVAGSPRLSMLVFNTSGDPGSLYTYRYYWSGDKRVLNSWGKWTFEDNSSILWCGFAGDYLYALLTRATGLTLERMRISENVEGRVLLDRRLVDTQFSSFTYDGGTDKTTIVTPFNYSGTYTYGLRVVTVDGNGLLTEYTPTIVAPNEFTVDGDITGLTTYIGTLYRSYITFPTPFVRSQKGGGEMVAIDKLLMIKGFTVSYQDARNITADLDVRGTTFSRSLTLSEPTTGRWVLPLLTVNTDMELSLGAATAYSFQLTNAEWSGQYAPKARRV